jgi:hypothetical protein
MLSPSGINTSHTPFSFKRAVVTPYIPILNVLGSDLDRDNDSVDAHFVSNRSAKFRVNSWGAGTRTSVPDISP